VAKITKPFPLDLPIGNGLDLLAGNGQGMAKKLKWEGYTLYFTFLGNMLGYSKLFRVYSKSSTRFLKIKF